MVENNCYGREQHGCHCGAATTPLRICPTGGDTAEVLNMLKVSAVPPPRSAVFTVFRGATAINDGTTAEPRRSWRCHFGLCRTIIAVAPRMRCGGCITCMIIGCANYVANKVNLVHVDGVET